MGPHGPDTEALSLWRICRRGAARAPVFEIMDGKLAHAEAYEAAAYLPVKAPLASSL